MHLVFRIHSLILICLIGCIGNNSRNSNTLFQKVPSDKTNITFINSIQETDSLNILTYEYMYNGGGVGILDVNNDGLNDIFFTGNLVDNALYLNQGNLQFKDISATSGIQASGTWCTGVSIVDINYDGYDDVYVCVGGPGNKSVFPNKLFINQGDLTFLEKAVEYGLADPGESNQATFFDYDKDGDLDMYLLTGGGLERSAIMVKPIITDGKSRNTDQLYQNNFDSIAGHPVFTNVSMEAGITIEGFGLGVSIIDANQDSWPDVYVSNDYLSRDLLYINNQDGTFTDQSLEYFKHTSHFSMGNDVGDINNDGLMDIITADMLPNDRMRNKLMFDPNKYDHFYQAVMRDYGYQYMRNSLQLNHGKNGFSEIGQLAGINKTDWSWAPLLADFDNDGYNDLYITNGFGKDITDLDFVNFRREAASPFADQMKLQNEFMEKAKQRPPIKISNFLFKNNQDLTFSNTTQEWGVSIPSISNGAAYADLDGDGDLEIIVNNINEEAYIFKNNSIEQNPSSSHFLNVALAGPKENPNGYGAIISIFCGNKSQHKYLQVAKGFQSSIEKNAHFGLSTDSIVDSLIVLWPDGLKSILKNIEADLTIKVNYLNAKTEKIGIDDKVNYFSSKPFLNLIHTEMEFNDFRSQTTLLNGFSKQGPGIAVGDVNGDGLDDVYIGGAYGANGSLFIQNTNSTFEERTIESKDFEDLGAIFFDADNDGDLDLYVTSGGSERYPEHVGYQDRLYINDGLGNFKRDEKALPKMISSTSSVSAADYDLDGDLDLFIGGRVIPTQFLGVPKSYILENENGFFKDVTDRICPSLSNIGMVTSAVWTDFNNDNKPDLILTGEFMRITMLENQNNRLVDITDNTGLKNSYGMWNSLLPVDLDNDGDMDYIAGNIGLNTPFKASKDHPFEVHFADFDNNGTMDPIFSEYNGGKAYPYSTFDQLKAQIPILGKFITTYSDFAIMTTGELLGLFKSVKYNSLKCTTLSSSVIKNLGNNQFEIISLPIEAQFAPVNGILAEDINMDGLADLILVGNDYSPEVVNGRYDASTGTVLINKGDFLLEPIKTLITNFLVNGNAKAMSRVELKGNKSGLIATQNNGPIETYIIDPYNGLERVPVMSDEVSAVLLLSDGKKQKMEFPIGNSYLSQSSKIVVVNPQIQKIEFFNAKGARTRLYQPSFNLNSNPN